jgi:hypothetical protein
MRASGGGLRFTEALEAALWERTSCERWQADTPKLRLHQRAGKEAEPAVKSAGRPLEGVSTRYASAWEKSRLPRWMQARPWSCAIAPHLLPRRCRSRRGWEQFGLLNDVSPACVQPFAGSDHYPPEV